MPFVVIVWPVRVMIWRSGKFGAAPWYGVDITGTHGSCPAAAEAFDHVRCTMNVPTSG
jgi:hypothetical protein